MTAPLASITSLFSVRVKQQVPDIVELLSAWNEAHGQADNWKTEADVIWDDMTLRIAKLLDEATIDDPAALAKLFTWLQQHLGMRVDVITQVHKTTRELADVIAHAIAAGSAALIQRSEDLQAGATLVSDFKTREEMLEAAENARIEE